MTYGVSQGFAQAYDADMMDKQKAYDNAVGYDVPNRPQLTLASLIETAMKAAQYAGMNAEALENQVSGLGGVEPTVGGLNSNAEDRPSSDLYRMEKALDAVTSALGRIEQANNRLARLRGSQAIEKSYSARNG